MTPAFHPAGAPVPVGMRTERLRLRPLRAADAERDYAAVMASAEQLRRWSQSEWPAAGFSLEENRSDLERHEREHAARTAFTFTVLDPAGTTCLGCVYIEAAGPELAPLFEDAAHAAVVGFWVRTSEIRGDLDRDLLAALRPWLSREWRFDRVAWVIVRAETRQAALLKEAGMTERAAFRRAEGRECRVFMEGGAKPRRDVSGRGSPS